MTGRFQGQCLPVLIGSLPLDDHRAAMELIAAVTPEIPLWVQLPRNARENMVAQFTPGMPGLVEAGGRVWVDTAGGDLDLALAAFYEDYLAAAEGEGNLDGTRFALTADTARGFFVLLDYLDRRSEPPLAVKGQITGPITFATGLKDQNGRAVFYDDQLRDAAVKLLALKARWQVRRLAAYGRPVIVFVDEPALAGFGTSEFISISRESLAACLAEVIGAVQAQGGLAGIHVCANTDWSVILDSGVDIVNFDAYGYFDKFILYGDLIRRFYDSGRTVAWGIVPTLRAEDIEKETVDTLCDLWQKEARQMEALGVPWAAIRSQALITPSCGTGSTAPQHAEKVLRLTRGISDRIRAEC